MDTQEQTPADYIFDSDEANFMADVIEASKTMPVIVDFWAPWCGPCKTLMPILERVVTAAGGAVRLVKVDIDKNQGIAQQLRVQSVPTVYAFKDGQPIDGFMGAQPESEISKFVGKLTGETDIVAEADILVARAKESLSAGDIGGAAQDFAGAMQMNPDNASAVAGLARIGLDSGDIEGAHAMVAQASDTVKEHPDMKSIIAALSLLDDAPSGNDESDKKDDGLADLQNAVEAKPDDLDARLELAKALAANGNNSGAIDQLLISVKTNRAHDDEAARKFLLTVFAAEGVTSEIAIDGRKRLSSILFS